MIFSSARVRLKQGAVLALAIMSVTCSAPKEPAPVSEASGNGARSGVTSADGFAALRTRYQDVLAALPSKVQSEPLMARLVEAALREGVASDKEALMAKFADDSIGLYLLDQRLKTVLATADDGSQAILGRVRKDYAGTALSLMAFDRELELNRTRRPEQFATDCEGAIQQGTEKEKAIALLRRAEQRYRTGDSKGAALDYLALWALRPAMVAEMGLPLRIAGCLKDAGFYWEATALELSKKPGDVASMLHKELAPMLEKTEQAEVPLALVYARATPDLNALQETASTIQGATFDEVLFLARVGCLAMYAGSPRGAESLLARCGEKLVAMFPLPVETETTHLVRLDDCVRVTVHDYLRAFSNYQMVETWTKSIRYHLDSREHSDLARALGRACFDLAVMLASRDGTSETPRIEEAVTTYVTVAEAINDRKLVADVYDDVVRRYPDSPLAATYLYKLGDLYKSTWKAPSKAAETYGQLRKRYPQSDLAAAAHLNEVVCLYEAEQYQEAYVASQEYVTERPQSEDTVSAKFLLALSEAAMGASDESETHLRDLVNQYPRSRLAPNALYMIGSASLAKQDYGKARAVFTDLCDRYPSSSYTQKAKEYVERLSRLDSSPAKSE